MTPKPSQALRVLPAVRLLTLRTEGARASLAYLIASAPWGLVKIETATSTGALLRHLTHQPEHVEDVGELDAARIANVARSMLPPPDDGGWIKATVQAARKAVLDAHLHVSATLVAGQVVAARARAGGESRRGIGYNASAGLVPAWRSEPSLRRQFNALGSGSRW